MINTGIVGYGAIGPVHARAIAKADGVRLSAVCDIDAARAAACAKEYGAAAYSDYDEMLSGGIDCVHICTPHYLHFEMVKKALERGINVVCEKPCVMTPAELGALSEIERASRAKLCCVVQNRENPCVKRFLSELASANKPPLSLSAALWWHRDEKYYASADWRGKWATEGGGLMINQAVHLLDLLCLAGGRIKTIRTSVSNKGIPSIEVEDTADAAIEFENGVQATFFATNLSGTNAPFFLEADFGDFRLRYADSMLWHISADCAQVLERDARISGEKAYWGTGHEAVIKKFYSELARGGEDFVHLDDVIPTMLALFEFYRGINGVNLAAAKKFAFFMNKSSCR